MSLSSPSSGKRSPKRDGGSSNTGGERRRSDGDDTPHDGGSNNNNNEGDTSRVMSVQELHELRRRRHERIARVAAGSGSGGDSTILDDDGSSTGGSYRLALQPPSSPRPGVTTNTTTTSGVEDEIERIREMRARRMRKERSAGALTTTSTTTNSGTTPADARATSVVGGGGDDDVSKSQRSRRSRRAMSPTPPSSSKTVIPTRAKSVGIGSIPGLEQKMMTGFKPDTTLWSASASTRRKATPSSEATALNSSSNSNNDSSSRLIPGTSDHDSTTSSSAYSRSSARTATTATTTTASTMLLDEENSVVPSRMASDRSRRSGSTRSKSTRSPRRGGGSDRREGTTAHSPPRSTLNTNQSSSRRFQLVIADHDVQQPPQQQPPPDSSTASTDGASSRILERREARASDRRNARRASLEASSSSVGASGEPTTATTTSSDAPQQDHQPTRHQSVNTTGGTGRTEVQRRLARHKSADGGRLFPHATATGVTREALESSSLAPRPTTQPGEVDGTTPSSSRMAEVERRLAFRKSGDAGGNILTRMAASTRAVIVNREALESSRYTSEVERRLARRRNSNDGDVLVTQPTPMISRDELDASSRSQSKPTTGPASARDLILDPCPTSDFSIKVRILSAIELPTNVLPNTPLCPVVKVGFVRIPPDVTTPENATSLVLDKLGSDSMERLANSRARATTCKLMGKRDNGSVDFYQELRWDQVPDVRQVGVVVEVAARAVRTPANYDESPPPIHVQTAGLPNRLPMSPLPTKRISVMAAVANSPKPVPLENDETANSMTKSTSVTDEDGAGGLRALWRKATNRKTDELKAAEAAAAIARMLVEQETPENSSTRSLGLSPRQQDQSKLSDPRQIQYNVALQKVGNYPGNRRLTNDLRLGCLVIPLSQLSLDKVAKSQSECATLEKWFQLSAKDDDDDFGHARKKMPSIRLELTYSHTDTMDEAEEKVEIEDIAESTMNSSLKRLSIRDDSEGGMVDGSSHARPSEKQDALNPVLQPGVIDFIAIVGCTKLGNQTADNGAKGWIEASPECTVLEQFPPNNDFHLMNGRKALLPEMVQWFCYPEGPRAWRGAGPPSYSDMKLKRFSASAPPNLASSVAAFDACLNCTTSFSWFVIASNSDEYGSKLVKTYGAVLRFYVPTPAGEDPKQQDYADTERPTKGNKRIWVPMAICFTSNLPIVGIMEAMMLRLCEDLSSKMGHAMATPELKSTHEALWDLIVKFQKPIAGTVNCSMPFLSGERFLLSLPSPNGLPPIPHGKAVVSTCRLLGPDGLNFLLAAALTECKILIHSNNIADVAMVAEVVTALLYPFTWSLPYIPVLPLGMLEFVEAPLSYMLGVPTQNLRLTDPMALEDVVVIDLDSGFSSSTSLARRNASKPGANKNSPPLPSQVANNIARAVHKLLRAEEDLDMEFGMMDMACHSLPGLETESLAEREFRVSVAIEICSLLRGYHECTGTVFNRDKFLKVAPAIYENKPDRLSRGHSRNSSSGKVVSARSKRFLSTVVNTQNFHQFLESLEEEGADASFFHEIMETFDETSPETSTTPFEKIVASLVKSLQKAEDKVPTYRLAGRDDDKDSDFIFDEKVFDILSDDVAFDSAEQEISSSFTNHLLVPMDPVDDENTTENLKKSETMPWKYNSLLDIALLDIEKTGGDKNEQVNLRQALGERRYRAWRIEQDEKGADNIDLALSQTHLNAAKRGNALDLTVLVSSVSSDDSLEHLLPASDSGSLRQTAPNPRQQKITDAKDRDIIRRCLDRANQKNAGEKPFIENGRDLLSESEKALRNPSAQRFLLSVLAQRTRLEGQRMRINRRGSTWQIPTSRLDSVAFDCLVRMSCAILDSCMDYKEYETAYRLLTLTAGFTTIEEDPSGGEDGGIQLIVMTSRIAIHPVFANLAVWKTVMNLHLIDRRNEKKTEVRQKDNASVSSEEEVDDDEDESEYEAAVATLFEMQGYNVPGEELSRFATRVSEEKGWFNSDDRGRQLLVLARRITVRRDQAETGRPSGESGLEIIGRAQDQHESLGDSDLPEARKRIVDEKSWTEIAWCQPAAQSFHGASSQSSEEGIENEYMKRSPVTALASFGQSVAVSAGLDGGVFLAYSINGSKKGVQGIHLDWGSASRGTVSSSLDGEYGVGAVSCIATAFGGGGQQSLDHVPSISGGTDEDNDEERYRESLTKYIDGGRVVAGTTAGDLRVWSVKDILSSLFAAKSGDQPDATTKSALTRLKFSLRGRALAGHRGGVTAIDVPSQVYRPDSIVTGGADGLLKLWSLRSPVSGVRSSNGSNGGQPGGETPDAQRGRGGDAMSVLTGHSGRVACVKTAWHGDRLISGGADRTIRVWDLAAGGKCLNSLVGHSGWVTSLREWGSNTIVSGSTDRTLALYDARVSKLPLFTLRYHDAPITDVLVGSRTDPIIISASADGSIATWDFRSLSQASDSEPTSAHGWSGKVVREPKVPMSHDTSPSSSKPGQVFLCRSAVNPDTSFMSLGADTVVREWDVNSGRMESEHRTGFSDMISGFIPCKTATIHHIDNQSTGYVMSSLDGTVRMRRLETIGV